MDTLHGVSLKRVLSCVLALILLGASLSPWPAPPSITPASQLEVQSLGKILMP